MKQVWGDVMERMQRIKFGGGYDGINCVKTQFVKGWKECIEKKEIFMCWVNTNLK